MAEPQGLLSGPNQTLTLAFFFGLIFQAGLASFLLFTKGQWKTIFKDGPRLVLVLFLLFGGMLWAQINFGALLIPNSAPGFCQGILIFSTVLDQLARVSMEQFLLWKLSSGTKVSLLAFIMQGILLIRLVAGGVLVGFSRPSFAPTCVAQTSLLPAPIVVLTLDIIIISFFVIRAVSMGMFGDLRNKKLDSKRRQSKAFILTTASFILWTATSIVMTLGLPGFMLILRMGAPANGLLVLISVVTIFFDALLLPRDDTATTPEAQSPFVAPETTTRDMPREFVGSGLPSGNRFGRNSSQFFGLNETSRDSSAFPNPNRRTSNRGFIRLDETPTQMFGVSNAEQQSAARGAAGYRGSSGVFGAIVAAPTINQKIQPSPVFSLPRDGIRDAAVQKSSLFPWSKPPAKVPIRNLGISRPIMVSGEDSEDRPFTRMPTIDLTTAAQNDRERRQAAFGGASPLSNNPVPPRRLNSLQQELNQSMSGSAKEIAPSRRRELSPIPDSVNTSLLSNGIGASSTSTSLSPGREEIRRRSPRNMSGFNFNLDEKPMIAPLPQKKGTLGLPSNPRAPRPGTSRSPQPAAPIVMLMNDIVYDNPGVVKTIIQDAAASQQAIQRPKTADQSSIASYTTTVKSPNSMIHRPRPYKRDSEKDRALFPAEPKSRHKRSRSLGSAFTSQATISSSYSSTLNALPRLTAVPRSAAELKKILPNDTKSMSFDEKVQLLFPAPPRSAILQNRRSSVPSVPRVPSEFMCESPRLRSPTYQSSRASKRTTIASFAKLNEPSIYIGSPKRQSSKDEHTAQTSQTTEIDEISYDESRTAGQWEERVRIDEIQDSAQTRQSISTESGSTEISEVSTYWGSVHSKIPPVDLREARQNARSTFIKGPVKIPYEDNIPVMLDDDASSYSSFIDNRRTSGQPSQDDCKNGQDCHQEMSLYHPAFHHRIGDQLPTFSERDPHIRTRKMPPPTPLLLNRMGRSANIVIHAAEPSPVESPEKAIEEIKAQLERFESSDRLSFTSSQNTGNSQFRIQDRFRMLENLEREMLEIEQLQNRLGSDSTSSSLTSSPIPPPKVSLMSQMISNRISKRLSRGSGRADRGERRLSSLIGGESSNSPSGQSSDNSRASLWQQRLAEAQMAYTENAPSLLRNSFNFLAMSSMQIASPTPPESEESGTEMDDESDANSDMETALPRRELLTRKPAAKLWEPAPISPQAAFGRLWSYPNDIPDRHASYFEPPAKNVKPRARVQGQLSRISSSSLWSKPTISINPRSTSGLWRSKNFRPSSIATKQRISIKPKRTTRRLTVLPDIVESPVPVPHNRDTLGIFQFPWGETSDQPVYQPNFAPSVPFSSFTASSSLNARSMELEPEGAGYSSSFFDDYDDEESGDSEANYDDSDDDFDDNTLLEIAGLLKSDDVPSRQSLFSPGAIVEGYTEVIEIESDSDVDEPRAKFLQPQIRLPIPPLDLSTKSPTSARKAEYSEDTFVSSSEGEVDVEMEPSMTVARAFAPKNTQRATPYTGLFKMDSKQPISLGIEILPEINRNERLLPNSGSGLRSQDESALPQQERTSTFAASKSAAVVSCSALWSMPLAKPVQSISGLFTPSQPSSRTTSLVPAAHNLVRKPRLFVSSIPLLKSKNLWSRSQSFSLEHDWISESSIRATSPSAYSLSPFPGEMTPGSEVDSIFDALSIRTSSTKTSTLWETMSSSTPIWWEARSGSLSLKRNPSSSPLSAEVQKPSSVRPINPAAREAELNSRVPRLRRQKSRETCQKTKEATDAISRPKTPETPKTPTSQELDLMSLSGLSSSGVPPLPSLNRRKTALFHHRPQTFASNVALSEVITAGTNANSSPMATISNEAWIEELNKKAVIVGPVSTKKERPVVTEAEWIIALNEAVMAGKMNKPKIPTVTKEEWVKALKLAVKGGEATNVQHLGLWSASLQVVPTSTSTALWDKKSAPEKLISKGLFSVSVPKTRKPLPAEKPEYAVLKSTELWRPNQAPSKEINWLSPPPQLQRTDTWTALQMAPAPPISNTKLWSKAATFNSSSDKGIFTHSKSAPIKRSASTRPATLQRLNSHELYRAPTGIADPINWLQRSTSMSSRTTVASSEKLQRSMSVREQKPNIKAGSTSGWMLPLHDPRVSHSFAFDHKGWT